VEVSVIAPNAEEPGGPALRVFPRKRSARKGLPAASLIEEPLARLVEPAWEEPPAPPATIPDKSSNRTAVRANGKPGAEAGSAFASRDPSREGGPGIVSPEPEGTTAFFQVSVRGQSIVYAIARSASRGPNGGLAAARRELLASLEQLPG